MFIFLFFAFTHLCAPLSSLFLKEMCTPAISSLESCFYTYGCFKDGLFTWYALLLKTAMGCIFGENADTPWSVNMLHGLQSHCITIISPVVKCSFGFTRVLVYSKYTLLHRNLVNRELRQVASLCLGKSLWGNTCQEWLLIS